MSKTVSGIKTVKILCRNFDFFVVGQKGSHVKLRKEKDGKIITTIVPLHKELALGTLKGLLELAKIDEKEFKERM